jgi:hypothetical protein
MHTFHSLRAALNELSCRLERVQGILLSTDEFIRPYPSDYHFDSQNQHYVDTMMLATIRDDMSFLNAMVDAHERLNDTLNVIVSLTVGTDVAGMMNDLREIEIRNATLHTLWNSVVVGETRRPRMRLADITNRQ